MGSLLFKKHEIYYFSMRRAIKIEQTPPQVFQNTQSVQVMKPSDSVYRQINPPLPSLILSESSVVSYYAVLHMAGRLSNPDTNLVYLKSNFKVL